MAEKKGKGNKDKISFLKERAIALLAHGKKKSASLRQIIRKLGIRKRDEKIILQDALNDLVTSGQIGRQKNGEFIGIEDIKGGSSGRSGLLQGRVDFVNPRFAFVICQGQDFDIKVSSSRMQYALDGDLVEVRMYPGKSGGKNPEGEIIRVLERGRSEFVGTIEVHSKYAFIIPDKRKMYQDIFIPLDKIADANDGDKVIVRITQWPDKDRKPEGEIIDVLGPAGNNDVEMHAIMAEFGLPYEFDKKTNQAADKISNEITDSDIKDRRDMRSVTTFTIDPHDAKDFDDALSYRQLENGNWEIGIHIADVSHYVKPGSDLDKEAFKRATSVYLVDRTIPMLPEKLSNVLCSLRPNEDKLTFSAIFEMDENAKILSEWFGRSIIRSNHRFSYEEAQEIIETKQGDYVNEILTLNKLAHKLRDERFRKGAISFETVEVKFRLDEDGKPLEVIPQIRKDAHKLIEDFMLLANRKVAEHIYYKKRSDSQLTMVYRIHEHPNTEKLNTLALFAKKFGYTLDFNKGSLSEIINKLTVDVEGKPEQNVLQSLAIRTMSKAKYTTAAEIHFGLGFKHYTHFTSPIRRYPDVMVHRLLAHYLAGGKSEDKELYESLCDHSSEMEKTASEAERASIKYKQVEFMQSMSDQDFDGIVSGLTEYGVFVEITETKCEGMVRMSEMDDDYYELDAENYRVIGKRNKKMITLGDNVKVKVKDTNLHKRTIDLVFV
jgi:ribonuclease R